MKIPEIQTNMRQLMKFNKRYREEHHLRYFRERMDLLIDDLSRKPRATNGAPVSRAIDHAMRSEIWRIHREEPDLAQHKIAERLNINAGRVSETIAGFRT